MLTGNQPHFGVCFSLLFKAKKPITSSLTVMSTIIKTQYFIHLFTTFPLKHNPTNFHDFLLLCIKLENTQQGHKLSLKCLLKLANEIFFLLQIIIFHNVSEHKHCRLNMNQEHILQRFYNSATITVT